jgi:hypothetical protein
LITSFTESTTSTKHQLKFQSKTYLILAEEGIKRCKEPEPTEKKQASENKQRDIDMQPDKTAVGLVNEDEHATRTARGQDQRG